MMISPKAYDMIVKHSDYNELIKERDLLIKQIWDFEEKERNGYRSDCDLDNFHSLQLNYQCNLDYLAELSSLMVDKYTADYVFGEKSLDD